MIPFKLRQLDHVVLRVRDLEASLRFYQDLLGCTLDKVQEKFGLWQLRVGASLIDLVPVDGLLGKAGGAGPGREGRNVDHFASEIDPFDEAKIRAHLEDHGIAIGEIARRYGAKGFGQSIYIEDPDGNSVELKGPPESSSR